MKKPHVLFVTEKYADGNPAIMSNSHHNLFGSLQCSELADHSNFFFEENPTFIDEQLIKYHRRIQPSLTVVTLLVKPGFNGNPTSKAFAEMSKTSPIVFVWFDTIFKFIEDMTKEHLPYSTLQVILDNPFFIPKNKYIHLWTPQDTRLYKDTGVKRDIDVSFMGSMGGYQDRGQYMNHLSYNVDAHILKDGGQRERNLSPAEYVSKMQRSKISLNFSKTITGLNQTKGRLWEITSCGAMMMEDSNLGTSMWFEPFKDYVPFTSQEDLVEKVKYYLEHTDEMSEIAGNGKKKTQINYNPKQWWGKIFRECGIQTSTN